MPVGRILMPWMSMLAARLRRLRHRRAFQLETLENRRSLSAGLISGNTVEVPADMGPVAATAAAAPDVAEQVGGQDASQGIDSGQASAASGPAASPAIAAATESPIVASPAAAISGEAKPVKPSAPGKGDQSSTDTNSNPSQEGGSGGGTNPAPGEPSVPDPTPAPAFTTRTVQDDFDPGLLDPLAWTLLEDETSGDGGDLFDAAEFVVPAGGSGSGGPATQMDRLDELGMGALSDSHSGVAWLRRFHGTDTRGSGPRSAPGSRVRVRRK